jgi:excisionase family DNA binding protein
LATKQSRKTEPLAARDGWGLLTNEEAAEYTGLSLRAIRTLTETGRLPAYKVTRRLLYRREDLDKVIEASRVER